MSDPIERQAAIDALGDEPEVWTGKDEYAQGLNNQWHYDRNAILTCPSAEPEHATCYLDSPCEYQNKNIALPSVHEREEKMDEWCHDCKEYDQERHCCPRWNRVIRTTVEELKAEHRWIPVTERLPEEDNCTGNGTQYSDEVLMTVVNAEDEETIIDYGHTVNGEWYSDTTDCLIPNHWKVTAWMPLPNPYKGEK